MSGHVWTKTADLAIYRIWASFIVFWSVLLHRREQNWCLWISRTHIHLLWGQGHARSRVPWWASIVHFGRNNYNFTASLSLGVIVQNKNNVIFGISTNKSTIKDPPCVKVIKGHPRSYGVTDLERHTMIKFSTEIDFRMF